MKKLLRFCQPAMVLLAVLSLPVHAAHGGGHGGGGGGHYSGHYGGHGGHHYGGWGWSGFALGAAVTSLAYWPYYGAPYYAPYYTEPAYVVPPYAPQANVVPQQIAVPAAASNWYYCKSGKAYYPYVQTCKEGWQTVPSVPPDL